MFPLKLKDILAAQAIFLISYHVSSMRILFRQAMFYNLCNCKQYTVILRFMQANVHFKNIFKVLLQKFLAESVLATLCGYVEWVNVKFLIQEKAILLQTLCLLLQENELRIKAAECLEAIAGRKVNLWNYRHHSIIINEQFSL